MRKISTLILLLLCTLCVAAEEKSETALPMMDVRAGKIILYPERMGMIGTESLMEALQSIPALVQKGTEDLLSNYILEENGNTYLQDPTIYLEQTRVSEVESIEITTDGSVSDGLSGVVGIINVVLKTPEEGTHGHVDLMATTHGEFYPTLYASYRKDKFTIFGSISGLVDRVKTDMTTHVDDMLSSISSDLSKNHTEALKVHMEWNLPSDYFLVKLSQLYEKDHATGYLENMIDSPTSVRESTATERDRKNNASLEYAHTFKSGAKLKAAVGIESLCVETTDNYEYPLANDNNLSSMDDVYVSTTNISTNLKFEHFFTDWFFFKVGIPISWSIADNNLYRMQDEVNGDDQLIKQEVKTRNDTYNPLIMMVFTPSKKWNIDLGVREVISRYVANHSDYAGWSKWKFATMASVGVQYMPTDKDIIQLSYRHSAEMPAIENLYPNRWLVQSPNIYFQGDPNLDPVKYQMCTLGYTRNMTNLQFTAKAEYYLTEGNIIAVQNNMYDGNGLNIVQCHSENGMNTNTVDLNLSAVWRYRKFQIMGGASVYHSFDADKNNVTWCCLRVVPNLQLPKQFTISAQLSYVSPQKSSTSHINASWYGMLRAEKRWNCGISAFLYWDNFLEGFYKETVRDTNSVQVSSTYFHENKLSIGISYTFL